MLERLDLIDWSKLHHAYGDASDVPGQIRALVSPLPEERAAAYESLFGNIHHQGTVYEASSHALPFLIELLEDEAIPQRDHLAALVACIIAGRGYYEVHASRVLINPFTKKPLPPNADVEAKIREEKRILAAVKKSGAPAIPLLVPFLGHESGDLRRSVADAFARYPSFAATTVPALERALTLETDDEVRDDLRRALDALSVGTR